ncbi:g2631 [Coccomyxa viridis]|uniref:G2631 protein n=1 Tax=Coccomyxa viridis TaxID=1274662 RepID=A0ABP1FKV6_9CHLO
MSQVVLALDVVTGLVGLGASPNAPTVSLQATTAAVNQTESYQPMLYNFVNATCYGSGTFKGAGYFEGPGNFTMDYGTFNGYGFINGSSGSYTGNATCNATDSTFYALAVSTLLTGAGTVSGSGIFNVPSGTFNGTGTFEGDDVTHYGGLATFQATYGTAKGSHSVTGESIRCESDSSGVFVGKGTADGYGNFVGTGSLDSSDGYFQGSGTFAGIGDCEGSQVTSS